MYYDANDLDSILVCKICDQKLKDPRLLPCGIVYCNRCVYASENESAIYSVQLSGVKAIKCQNCGKQHEIPREGFPENTLITKIVKLKSNDIFKEMLDMHKTKLKDIYNIVVLGNTGVGKSSILNMLAGKENAFKVGDSVDSQTHIASSQIHKFMDKVDSISLRLIDTQGLSDTGGDTKDMEHIVNMVEHIRQLEQIDLFLICFDGMNPRYTSYVQSTISLFSDIFPQFLSHSVLVFNKWTSPNTEKLINLKKEYQEKFLNNYNVSNIPCYFVDSFYKLKMLRDNDDGTQSEKYLHTKIQDRTNSQVLALITYMVVKQTTCDVRKIAPNFTPVKQVKNDKVDFKKENDEEKELLILRNIQKETENVLHQILDGKYLDEVIKIKDTLSPGEILKKGECLISENQVYKAVMHNDGNFVLHGSRALWASGTGGNGEFLTMQRDGNLVIYNNQDKPTWASNTYNLGHHLIM